MDFPDSNVWLYAFLPPEGDPKRQRAISIIERSNIVTSPNVINEVCSVLLRKGRISEDDLQSVIREFYLRCSIVTLDETDLVHASQLRKRYRLSFWDSLHVSAALKADASELLSEDMQDGLVVERRLLIRNPFNPL
jgi:predicted nucleic acid-binding protein